MYSVRVCSTDDRDLPAPELGVGLNWDRITEILRREVSPDAAELLAEPITDTAHGQTHWHITTTDDPLPLSALTGVERERLLRTLDDRRRAILNFVDRIAATNSEAELRLAAALRTVLDTPDPERHVWSAAGRPVLTAWGRKSREQLRRPATILGSAPKVAATPAQAASPIVGTAIVGREMPRSEPATPSAGTAAHLRPSSRSWLPALFSALLWVLLSSLILANIYLLLPACAVSTRLLHGVFDRCPVQARGALPALRERNLVLLEAVRAAEMKVAVNEGECAPPRRAQRQPLPGHDMDIGDDHTGTFVRKRHAIALSSGVAAGARIAVELRNSSNTGNQCRARITQTCANSFCHTHDLRGTSLPPLEIVKCQEQKMIAKAAIEKELSDPLPFTRLQHSRARRAVCNT